MRLRALLTLAWALASAGGSPFAFRRPALLDTARQPLPAAPGAAAAPAATVVIVVPQGEGCPPGAPCYEVAAPAAAPGVAAPEVAPAAPAPVVNAAPGNVVFPEDAFQPNLFAGAPIAGPTIPKKKPRPTVDPQIIIDLADAEADRITGEILNTGGNETMLEKERIQEAAKAADSSLYPHVEQKVEVAVKHMEEESEEMRIQRAVDAKKIFAKTQETANRKIHNLEETIKVTTAEAADKSQSRTLADQVRNAMEESTATISENKAAEKAMESATKQVIDSAHMTQAQWKKAVAQRDAGKPFAVAAGRESQTSVMEARTTVTEVKEALADAKVTSQRVDLAHEKAEASREHAEATLNLSTKVGRQVNHTLDGITWQETETDNVLKRSLHAVQEAQEATAAAEHLKATIPVRKPLEEGEPDPSAATGGDSEDAT